MSWLDQPQNSDGVPHFDYYDAPNQLSFVWDGFSPSIEVRYGGDGEPIVDQIEIPAGSFSSSRTPSRWLAWFQVVCQLYIKQKEMAE